MSTISIPYSFSPNTTILSAQVNSDFSTIYNEFNGNISDANISTLSESKITFTGTGHDHSGGSKGALVAMPLVNGRLVVASATSLIFLPYNGNRVFLKKSGAWTATTIPSGGVSAANTSVFVNGTGGQSLAASTLYRVYLFDNSGTLTIDFSTGVHATDTTTGMEIKSGDDTRILLGMIRTNASSQFQDDGVFRGLLNYFNRRNLSCQGTFTTDRSTSSTTIVELNSEIQVSFMNWDDEHVLVYLNGAGLNTGAGGERQTGIGIDSTTVATVATAAASGNASDRMDNSVIWAGHLTEAVWHTITVLGSVGSGTGTWFSADAAGTNASGANRLQAITRG